MGGVNAYRLQQARCLTIDLSQTSVSSHANHGSGMIWGRAWLGAEGYPCQPMSEEADFQVLLLQFLSPTVVTEYLNWSVFSRSLGHGHRPHVL